MGEAKQRRALRASQDQAAKEVDMARVARAVNRLCQAASVEQGADCILQADLARHLLLRLGVESQVVGGAAAWRLGEGDGDVISHVPAPGTNVSLAGLTKQIAFHAWLRVGTNLFDVTTADLRLKAQQLDEQDGGHTTVDWAPDFLFVPYAQVSSYREVAQGHAGLFFYQEDAAMTRVVRERIESVPQDDDALAMLWVAYQNPDAMIMGPNNIPVSGDDEDDVRVI